MVNIIHIPTGRDGMRRGGNEIIVREMIPYRKTATRLRTWKVMAERRNEVMDMVAQEVSWAKPDGTNKFVRLSMSLIRPRACVFLESQMRTQQKCRSSYESLGAVSCLRQSIHVVLQLLELDGDVERIWLTSGHRRGLPGQRS